MPITNRLHFVPVSRATEDIVFDMMWADMTNSGQLNSSEGVHKRDVNKVNRVFGRLMRANGDLWGPGDWTVVVIENDTPNAMVLGRHVIVHSALLTDWCADGDDKLAIVLGHELAHWVARHSMERLTLLGVRTAVTTVLSLFFGIFIPANVGELLMDLPVSRANEAEADHIGILLAARACYDVRQAVELWDERGEEEGDVSTMQEFLSTHPPSKERSAQLKAHIDEALQVRARAGCDDELSARDKLGRLFGFGP